MSKKKVECGFKVGDRAVQFAFGQRGVVQAVTPLAKPSNGSRFMVRMAWDGGAFGTIGDADLIHEAKR